MGGLSNVLQKMEPAVLQKILATIKQFRQQGQQQGQPGGQTAPSQMGGATPPFQPSTTQGGQGPRGTLPMPSGGGASPGQTGSGGGAGPASSSPTGGMLSTVDPQGSAVYSGFQGVGKLLQDWTSRKSQKEHVEASNIARNLISAMEKNDVATVHEILNDKNSTKVLNKVYKGWLTKSKEAQQPNEPPDPATSGFEKGLTDYIKGKTQQQPQMPKTMGGYLLPQAGPDQQLKGVQTGAELGAAQADPKRTMGSQLTSEEMRQAELGKAGLASTPASDAKLQESMAKLQQANLGVKKAEIELQTKQAELQASGQRTSDASKKADLDLQRAQVQLDITRTNLLIAHERQQTAVKGKTQQPPVATVGKLTALEQAESYVQDVLKSRGKAGFTGQDVQTLTGLLRQAGATSMAQSLPGWYGRNLPTWLGGKGEDDIAGMLESIQQLKEGVQTTIDTRYPGWREDGKKPAAKAGAPDEGDDEVDADIVVNPEDLTEGAKP